MQGTHVSPVEAVWHKKCDRQTDIHMDRQTDRWRRSDSFVSACFCRWYIWGHKNLNWQIWKVSSCSVCTATVYGRLTRETFVPTYSDVFKSFWFCYSVAKKPPKNPKTKKNLYEGCHPLYSLKIRIPTPCFWMHHQILCNCLTFSLHLGYQHSFLKPHDFSCGRNTVNLWL